MLHVTDLGIEKSIFIKPKTFHLTVLMLKLWNKERVNLAAEVLKVNSLKSYNQLDIGRFWHFLLNNLLLFYQSISSKVMDALDNRPIFVRLKGLVSLL